MKILSRDGVAQPGIVSDSSGKINSLSESECGACDDVIGLKVFCRLSKRVSRYVSLFCECRQLRNRESRALPAVPVSLLELRLC